MANELQATISAHDLLVAALGYADDSRRPTARHRDVVVLAKKSTSASSNKP